VIARLDLRSDHRKVRLTIPRTRRRHFTPVTTPATLAPHTECCVAPRLMLRGNFMKGMVVAPEPSAVEAGARVLLEGGNGVDAAVTCAFVQGVVNPQMCGVGGYALSVIQRPGRAAPELLDAPALAGALTTPDMWVDRYIGLNPDGWGYFLKG